MRHVEDRYPLAKELMTTMVAHSQRPGEGNRPFNEALSEKLTNLGLDHSTYPDPEYDDRELLVVDVGPTGGRQIVVATSHADVVGVEAQTWDSDPYRLRESGEVWIGRGVCDTHASGVGLLLAALDESLRRELTQRRLRISLLFTYDEESTTPELSMRGARLAAGLLGPEPVISAPYFIAGEPTEQNGRVTPMRANKGRLLAHFTTQTDRAGHASEEVGNALSSGARIVCLLDQYQRVLTELSRVDPDHGLFTPQSATLQVTAAQVKRADYSTTPDHARFTLDMRTLPAIHEACVKNIEALLRDRRLGAHATLSHRVEKNAPGTVTPATSPIVQIAQEATGVAARGFNGGDEGRVFRGPPLRMEGITLGPGRLCDAHAANEHIRVASIFAAADLYRTIFHRMAKQTLDCESSPTTP